MSEPINTEKRSQLSAAKQALLAKRLRGQLNAVNKSDNQEREADNSLPQIAPNPEIRHLPFPLTDMQQAYWIGRNSFFESGNVSIHSYVETESQNLDLDRFNRAWQRLIDRHDMLKAIVLPDGQQQILENLPPYEIKVLDLRGKSEEVIAAELQAVRDRLSHQVIPSDRWPLYEICASQLGDRHYRLHISIDGIFFDSRSYKILSKELIQLYQDPDCQLPPLELSFRDYVQGLLDLQTSEIYQKSLTYWQQRIPTIPPAPELPLANTGAAPQGSQFVRRRGTLEAEIWQKLKTRAARANVTPAGLLLAAYAEVLATWSKNPRFTINVPRFDRFPLHPQVTHLIGEFASFTLLEVDFSEPNSFEVRAKRLQQQLWQDLEHQYVSGVRVLRELARYQGNTLGVTMPIVFTSSPQDVDGKETTPIDAPVDLGAIAYSLTQTPQVWLDFMYHESKGALVFNVDAVENRFAPGVVEAMFHTYSKLLTCLAEGEESWQEIGRSLVPEDQLQQRAAINATDAPMPETTLYQLFCDRVQEAPEQVAVTTSDCTLTYAEVYERSQQLGYRLRELGATPNTLVAVFMEKGWEQIVAVMGILAAGAAYLPLDPELPQERLDYLLQDAGVQQVLTQSKLLGTRVLPAGIQPICVDGQDLSNANPAPLPSVNTADDLAYVIYTSGSTGLPKGVAIAHRSVVNTVIATNQRFEITASDRAIALTALHHDLSVFDIFGILAAGGTLVIPDAAQRRDPAHWSQLLQQERVTFWNSVPAMMEMLLEYTNSHPHLTFSNLRLTILGGDWIPVAIPSRLKAVAPNVQFVSIGGPTETTIWNIWHPVETVAPHQKSIPYGKPIANNRYYILNDALEDRPVWVPGQMYCAGVGLAQGYWRNDAKTRENFITHPRTGERLYCTGDMGRYLPDGNIEFLSRVDFQVKIRGHRIEPGEIEATVIKHPAVRASVVVAVGDRADHKQLVAYIVPKAAPTPELAEELLQFLREKLPPYMVPAMVMVLEALPLTPNGKVDRKGLPTPDLPGREKTYLAPRTPIETQLAALWSEVLEIDQIGVDDSFFELGGHSLLAIQVISRVRETFQVELALKTIFEATTLATLAESIETAMKAELGLDAAPIVPAPREGELPLSFAQQRLWFLDRLEPNSASYNLPRIVRITGDLNPTTLEHCVTEILRRHEILRTQFVTSNGRPVQQILPATPFSLPVIDLQNLSPEECEAEVHRLAEAEANQGFNLESDRLLRGHLLKLSASEWILLFTLHHIISDGWSTGVLVRELAALYPAFSEGKPSPLPELPIQYVDFALWQQNWLKGEVLEQQIGYWKQQLSGSLPVLELPTDKPRPPVQTFRGHTASFTLPSTVSESLKGLSRGQGVTLYMTLLAAFKTLLYRYSRQTDILVGSPIANRNRREIEPLIGCFINTLVLRSDLSNNPTFSQLLAQVRDIVLNASAHQDLPFEKLVEVLQPERDLSRPPIIQVMFVFQNASGAPLKLPNLTFQLLENQNRTATYDVTVYLEETEAGLQTTWQYNTDLFEPATIQRMQEHWQTLLTAVASAPNTPIADLPLLTPAEEQQLLAQGNQTQADYPQTACLHHLFEAQVQRTLDAVAVEFEGHHLTYQELNTKANQLAHYLQGVGVGPEQFVALCVERSLDMVIALLGILKSGAAYLPLDPAYPSERLQFTLNDAGVSVLLTHQHLVPGLPHHPAQVICLDTDWDTIAPSPSENPISLVKAKDLAYIIYTSGSTGQPKGVEIPHRALVNFLTSMQQQPGLNCTDILLSVTTLSFDIAALELFLPLIVGAKLVVVSREVAIDGFRLGETLNASGATVMQATPATWRLLLAASWQGNPGLKILCGGEAFDRTLAQQLQDRCGELWNMYGPTETTIWSLVHRLNDCAGAVAIGRPIANTQVYVLDSHLHPVPIGVPGELYIGGDGLARGYLNRPELTAERFIPHPYEQGSRLYKTGDLVRYLPDGTLEFIARLDNQVKLRGYRIELGEIEAVLAQHPHVQQAVVTVREERLVAYWVSAGDTLADRGEFEAFLKPRLPAYMMPTAFVNLEALPLTPNGKVDRKALPAVEELGSTAHTFIAPRTAIEEQVAQIWQELLNCEPVGIRDNFFFDLGGHSLLATQVISRLRQTFDVDVPLMHLFESPTVEEFSLILTEKIAEQTDEDLLAKTLAELEQLSDEDVQALLATS